MKKIKYLLFAVPVVLFFVFSSSTEEEIKNKKSDSTPQVEKEINSSTDESNVDYRKELVQTEEKRNEEYNKVIERHHERGAKSNVPITFYAQVLDQHKNPVSDVEVTLEISKYNESFLIQAFAANGTPNRHSKENLKLKTDSNGYFEVKGEKARKLSVRSLQKKGYLDKPNNRHFQAWKGNQVFGEQTNPLIYTLWKEGEDTEYLVKFSRKLKIKGDDPNKSYSMNLLSGSNSTNLSQGDLIVRVDNPGRLDSFQGNYSWKVTLRSIDPKGLQLTNDTFLYIAPDSGYENEIVFEVNADDPKWESSFTNKKLYFKSGNNYGSVLLSANAYHTGNVTVRFNEIIINPNGSRNLEYDPAKDVTNQYVKR